MPECAPSKAIKVETVSSSRLLVIVGPTATGKSDLAVEIASEMGGEVVNADAMQLYAGMDIGTAKLPGGQRRGVPHHLLDVLDVTEAASVAVYQQRARELIERILNRNRIPVLTGGSGLYVQAVLDELRFPGTDPTVRAKWNGQLRIHGASELHRRLAQQDPDAAESILPSNGRRIVRALEVIEITGERFSANLPTSGPPRYGAVMIGLDRQARELDTRVDHRVTQMFDTGLVDEVRRLERRGLRRGPTASRALGYQQVLAELDGANDMAVASAETARLTRRFVRRQRSWFRRDKRINWLDAAEANLVSRACSLLGAVD